MSPVEFAQFSDNDRKTKARHIAFGGFFYRDLYTLAEHVFDSIDGKRDSEFTRLPKKTQRTVVIHAIGKIVAGQRRKETRADMAGNHFIELSEYEGCTHFYSLSQKGIFDILRSRYGESLATTMKITVDDKIRVAGLVITKAPLREYLSDLTGRSRGGDRQALDASRSRRNAGLQLLHANFIDKTMAVAIPPKWFEDETKEKIDEFMGEGTYNEHGGFDPNNQTRIALPWTVKETTAIFNKLDQEYHKTMDKYTMGTGGGPGDDANFAAWQQRDECNVVRYTNQPAHIYLSVVHSWDKLFGFPFVSFKDPLPMECAIDSSFDMSGIGDDFDDNNIIGGDSVSGTNQEATYRTPRQATTGASRTSSRSSRREKGIANALEELSESRMETNKVSEDLLRYIQGGDQGRTMNMQPHDVLEHVSKTRRLLAEYKDEIKLQRQQKELILASADPTEDKKRKMRNLSKEIIKNKKWVATLNTTLAHQRLQLESLTKNDDEDNGGGETRDDDVSSESGMSNFSDVE
jgi:hypothetical protein